MKIRKPAPPYHVRIHQKVSFRLCMKRHFSLSDPEIPSVQETCKALLGDKGWTFKDEQVTETGAFRKVLYVQKVFKLREDAVSAGKLLLETMKPRERPSGHAKARSWIVTAPDGGMFRVKNLLHWCRQNSQKFEPSDTPGALVQSGLTLADRVYAGLRDPRQRAWRGWSCIKTL